MRVQCFDHISTRRRALAPTDRRQGRLQHDPDRPRASARHAPRRHMTAHARPQACLRGLSRALAGSPYSHTSRATHSAHAAPTVAPTEHATAARAPARASERGVAQHASPTSQLPFPTSLWPRSPESAPRHGPRVRPDRLRAGRASGLPPGHAVCRPWPLQGGDMRGVAMPGWARLSGCAAYRGRRRRPTRRHIAHQLRPRRLRGWRGAGLLRTGGR